MGAMRDAGYGIWINDLERRADAMQKYMNEYAAKEVLACFDDFNEDYPKEGFSSEQERLEAFFDDWYDTEHYGGFVAAVIETIREREGLSDRTGACFVYDDGAVFVQYGIPYDDAHKAVLLTRHRIDEILQKYIPVFYEGDIEAGHIEIYD